MLAIYNNKLYNMKSGRVHLNVHFTPGKTKKQDLLQFSVPSARA